jgi:hypothetical protein
MPETRIDEGYNDTGVLRNHGNRGFVATPREGIRLTGPGTAVTAVPFSRYNGHNGKAIAGFTLLIE